MTAPISRLERSCFLNVDLEVFSNQDLRPLVDSFGPAVIEMYVGKVRRTHEAHLELAWRRSQSPTSIILGFCRLVQALPRSKRKLWNSARIRSFDIGIEAPAKYRNFWSAVSPEAVRAAAEVGAQIAVTVYGRTKPMKGRGKAKKPTKLSE
jgi:hypothetical protein